MEGESPKNPLKEMSIKEVDGLVRELAVLAGKLQFAAEDEFHNQCVSVLSGECGLSENSAADEAQNIWWSVIRIRVEAHRSWLRSLMSDHAERQE